MGSAASVESGVKDAINTTVNKIVVAPLPGSKSTSSRLRDALAPHRPVLLMSMSIKSFALKKQSKHQMHYMQDPMFESFRHSAAVAGESSNAIKRPPGLSLHLDLGGGSGRSAPKDSGGRPKMALKLNVGNEDEADWVQVSEDEDDLVLSPRARKNKYLDAAANQSYLFTKSGTIFVDGFSEGIGKDGIHDNGESSHFPITERLVLLSNLGHGASGTVYKALDLQEMRLVALKMISVFDRNKRRQMVRELGALFAMLRSAEFSGGDASAGAAGAAAGGAKGRQSKAVEFKDIIRRSSLRPESEEFGVKAPREYIVDFYDAFSNLEDGGVALMMELMDGGSLQDIVDAGGCASEDTLASIAFQALSGLEFLHSCNQIHRDIKPANILINHDGVVKISDLGILKKIDPIPVSGGVAMHLLPTIQSMEIPDSPKLHPAASAATEAAAAGTAAAVGVEGGGGATERKEDDDTGKETDREKGGIEGAGAAAGGDSGKHLNIHAHEMYRANTFVGTLTYMAPERIDGRSYTFNSDVWSLGLTMMSVAQGSLSVDTANGYWSILNSIRDKEPPRLPDNGKWSEEFRDFVAQCLTQSPANRPSCTELLKHAFVLRAAPDSAEEDAAGRTARGLEDLQSIIAATYTHLLRLKEEYERVSLSAKTPISAVTNHLLAHAVESQGADEVLKLLLFGKEPSLRGNDAFSGESSTNTNTSTAAAVTQPRGMSHRLQTLSQQLQLPLNVTLREARKIYTTVVGTNFNSDPNLRILFEEKVGPPDLATPKARHG